MKGNFAQLNHKMLHNIAKKLFLFFFNFYFEKLIKPQNNFENVCDMYLHVNPWSSSSLMLSK